MSPSVGELVTAPAQPFADSDKKQPLKAKEELSGPQNINPYSFYEPHLDVNEKFPPIEIFEFSDPGLRADPTKPHLLTPNVTKKHLSPYIGTELKGVQISQLGKEGLDELALFVAERKLVVFRDQDFKDIGPERQIEIARHFGPIQCHPTSANVKGYPEFLLVVRRTDLSDQANRTSWHTDVTYERQPPGTTFFFILRQPSLGGDTLFASQVEAYNRLSPEFQKRLQGLTAVHSAVVQADNAKRRGRPVRREAIETEHPLVRQHPVTGEKALFVNHGYTKRIVGFKPEESECLLKFLFDHVSKGADFHVRATYEPGTVVVWDNRVTVHSATRDFPLDEDRLAVRLTPQAEIPIPA